MGFQTQPPDLLLNVTSDCRRGMCSGSEVPRPDSTDQLIERRDAVAVDSGMQIRFIEQHRANAGRSRAHDVDLVDIPDVDR